MRLCGSPDGAGTQPGVCIARMRSWSSPLWFLLQPSHSRVHCTVQCGLRSCSKATSNPTYFRAVDNGQVTTFAISTAIGLPANLFYSSTTKVFASSGSVGTGPACNGLAVQFRLTDCGTQGGKILSHARFSSPSGSSTGPCGFSIQQVKVDFPWLNVTSSQTLDVCAYEPTYRWKWNEACCANTTGPVD